jgi:hypothetical protein
MKLTIEIQKQYYDIARDNPASLILEVALSRLEGVCI